MFGLFKKEPVQIEPIEAEVEIHAPSERVFDLLDFAASGNALRERGFEFDVASEIGIGRFEAVAPDMPDVRFIFTVDDHDAPARISFTTKMISDEPIGALETSRSVYTVEETGTGSCRVAVIETPTFQSGLRRRALEFEQTMMTLSVHADLARLKVHAEEGPEAANAALPFA